MKKILIVDGNNLGWRAFGHAPLTHEGQRTEVIHTGASMFRKYLEMFEPDFALIAWDGGLDEGRVTLFPDYKRKRRVLTEVEKKERKLFFEQMEKLIGVFEELGIVQYRLKNPPREADDVIYTLATLRLTHTFIIVSTDEDMFQLFNLSDKITVYSPAKKLMITRALAEEACGVSMKDFIFYKAMIGDKSDNLPGIKGIGPVKARELCKVPNGGGAFVDYKLVDLFMENEKTFHLMCDLIRFEQIPVEEIKKGQIGSDITRPNTTSDLYSRAVDQLEKYGLKSWLDKIELFVEPFEKLLIKGRAIKK